MKPIFRERQRAVQIHADGFKTMRLSGVARQVHRYPDKLEDVPSVLLAVLAFGEGVVEPDTFGHRARINEFRCTK